MYVQKTIFLSKQYRHVELRKPNLLSVMSSERKVENADNVKMLYTGMQQKKADKVETRVLI